MIVTIRKDLEITMSDLAQSMTPVEMLQLFTMAANQMDANEGKDDRRAIAVQSAYVLSENALRLLAEIMTAEYVRIGSLHKGVTF